MKISIYDIADKEKWDEFVAKSKNGTFLFYRDYMDYHSARFTDNSLIIYGEKGEIISLLPANKDESVLISHEGLTYGGFVTDSRMTTPKMVRMFDRVIKYLKENGFSKLVYKTIPSIYHIVPAEEDRYVLFLHNAKLARRDVLSVINLDNRIRLQQRRARSIKKALKNNLVCEKVDDFRSYWKILEDNLAAFHSVKPTHTLEEIESLAEKFKDNIKLFASYLNQVMLAGIVIFESANVSHVQYIANSMEGRKIGALDMTFDFLIKRYSRDKKYFDFGISNENQGRYLNIGLVEQKEGFGARAIVHDFYELNL